MLGNTFIILHGQLFDTYSPCVPPFTLNIDGDIEADNKVRHQLSSQPIVFNSLKLSDSYFPPSMANTYTYSIFKVPAEEQHSDYTNTTVTKC